MNLALPDETWRKIWWSYETYDKYVHLENHVLHPSKWCSTPWFSMLSHLSGYLKGLGRNSGDDMIEHESSEIIDFCDNISLKRKQELGCHFYPDPDKINIESSVYICVIGGIWFEIDYPDNPDNPDTWWIMMIHRISPLGFSPTRLLDSQELANSLPARKPDTPSGQALMKRHGKSLFGDWWVWMELEL